MRPFGGTAERYGWVGMGVLARLGVSEGVDGIYPYSECRMGGTALVQPLGAIRGVWRLWTGLVGGAGDKRLARDQHTSGCA